MDREPYNFNPRFLLTVFIFSLVVTIWILINTFFFTPYSIDQTASTGDFSMSIKVDSSIKTRKNTKVYATAKDKNSIGKQKKGSIGIALEGPVNKDFWKIDFETGIDGYVEKDHISYYSDPTRDTIPPTLLMLSPKGNISVSGTVHFKLDVSDNRGIDHVDFIIDGVTVKTLTQAPY
ncbi:MAG TPA: Ig-like domain-containing protein, partial [Candidatus Paceibacterota bacterium]